MVAAWKLLIDCNRSLFRSINRLKLQTRFYRGTSNGGRNMSVYLQILGTGSSEASPTVFLFTESNRYLFNCSEGTQTVCYEHGVKFSRLRNVFITRLSWENVGGLPGLVMSLRDRGNLAEDKMAVTVHGPSSLNDFQSISATTYLKQESLTININTFPTPDSPLVYKTDELTIKGYRVSTNDSRPVDTLSQLDGDTDGCGEPEAKRPCLRYDYQGDVVFYVCQLSKTMGKFHPEKAKELGVPKGRLFGELTSGNAVVTPSGRTVFPHEVMDPTVPGPSFIIVECPSLSYLKPLLNNPELQPSSTNPDIIIHIAPRRVIEDDQYRDWMKGFSDKVRHVVLHREVCQPEIVSRHCYKLRIPLHLIDSSTFHIPAVPYSQQSLQASTTITGPQQPCYIPGRSLMKFHLKPKSKYGVIEDNVLPSLETSLDDHIAQIKADTQLLSKLAQRLPDVLKAISAISTKSIASSVKDRLPKESSVTFLGTASSSASPYRNQSAILLHLANGFMLLDCGEGTLGQLYKCYGQEGADRVLSNLKSVFVSHIHGDHHLGLIRIIQRRYKLLVQQQNDSIDIIPPLLIIGPSILRDWLEKYRRHCEHLPFWFQNSLAFVDQTNPATLHLSLRELGFSSVSTVRVIHIAQSYGVVLEHSEGWKLVYSGDTLPCYDLAEAGKGATLLIHEATFDSTLAEEAHSKKHCTLSDAMAISTAMEAQSTIYTHFSQRYPKFPTAIGSNIDAPQRLAFAFDFMTVPIVSDGSNEQKLADLQPFIYDIFTTLLDPKIVD